MKSRIWSEMSQGKKNEIFASLYAMAQRRYLGYFNIMIALTSSGGVMGWSVWKYAPLLASGIVAIASILKQVQQYVLFDEVKLSKLISIQNFYCDYYNKLEVLWYDLYNERISEEEASKRFYQIKAAENEINTTVNETIVKHPRRLIEKAQKGMVDYLSFVFTNER